VTGHVVVFWEYLEDAKPADLVTLAHCLRQLHAVAVPTGTILRPVNPFGRFEERLAAAAVLSPDDKQFLTGYRDELANQWPLLSLDLPTCVVHGDAHMENLLRTASGHVAFVDLESVAIGHPEWDLTLTALYLGVRVVYRRPIRRVVFVGGHDAASPRFGHEGAPRSDRQAGQRPGPPGGGSRPSSACTAARSGALEPVSPKHNWADCVLPRGFDKKRFEKELMIIAPILYVAVLVGINAAIAKIGMTPHPGLVRSCRPRWQPGRPRQGHDAASMVGVVVP
jgi:hypothetical protein